MAKRAEHLRTWRIGLLFALATLGHGVAVHAQGVGTASDTTPAVAGSGNLSVGPGPGAPATVERGGTVNSLSRRGTTTDLSDRATTTPRLTSRSFNRVTTARQEVMATSSRTVRPGGTSFASSDSLHPYSDQMLQAQSGRANSEIPSSSSQQARPESQPVMVRSTPHNYYPSIRTGRYPNANTAQISRSGIGVPRLCVPNRGNAMAGAVRGR